MTNISSETLMPIYFTDIPENDLLEFAVKMQKAHQKYESLPQELREEYEALLEEEKMIELEVWHAYVCNYIHKTSFVQAITL